MAPLQRANRAPVSAARGKFVPDSLKHRMPRHQRGQSLIETCVVITVFGTLLLGIFQAILFYRAKTVVDYAALQAARSGATNFAEKDAMKVGLARGLMPLYASESGNAGLADAYAKALIAVHNPLSTHIDIISPTRAVFDEFKTAQFDGSEGIPNDSLAFRPDTPGASGLSVQDANILKIRVVYGYKMIVPVVDKIVVGIFRKAFYKGLSVQEVAMLESGRLPIVAQAIVRMQTPILDRNLLADASSGDGGSDTPPGGGGDPGTGDPGSGDPGGGSDTPPGGGDNPPGGGDDPGGGDPGGDDGGPTCSGDGGVGP